MPSQARQQLDLGLQELADLEALIQLKTRGTRGPTAGISAGRRAAVLLLNAHFEAYLEDLLQEALACLNPGLDASSLRRNFTTPRPDNIDKFFVLLGISRLSHKPKWQKAGNKAVRTQIAADERDRDGERRDHAADQRDQVGEQLDQAVEESHARVSEASVAVVLRRSALARREGASDRRRASQDRMAGASERTDSELDRDTALADRGSGASERDQAAFDRDAALADRQASAREREGSSLDALTGAYVRGAGFVELEREIARARRTAQPLVLAFVDVDHLKALNDSQGHAAGDRTLLKVAETLRAELRSHDLLIRYGGDEFVCAISGLELTDATERFALVDAALLRAPEGTSVTVGLTELQPGDSPEDLVARADIALYREREEQRGPASADHVRKYTVLGTSSSARKGPSQSPCSSSMTNRPTGITGFR